MMDRINEVIQANATFILFVLAFTFTMMNIVTGFGVLLLVLLILLIVMTPYFLKSGETIDYWQFIINKVNLYGQKIAKANERRLQWENEQAEIRKQQQEQEEKESLELEQKERQRRAEEIDKELAKTHIMLKEQGISESAIAIALEEKRINMLRENERKSISSEQQEVSDYSQQNAGVDSTPFELKKHGKTLNRIMFGLGFIFLLIISSLIFSILDFSLTSGVTVAGLLVLFLFTFIFYLPTFLYHASVSAKFFVFILNMVFGGTILGWIVLLIIVNSKNKEYAFREELLHYQRNQETIK